MTRIYKVRLPSCFAKNAAAVPSTHSWTSTVQSSNVVRDLGVHFDSELTIKRHVSKVVSICCYQLRKLHQTVLKQVVTLFVLSRIDYCNSLLISLPTTTCPERCSTPCTWLRSPSTHYTGAKTTTLVASSIIDYNSKSLHSCTRSTIVTALSILSTWSVSRQMRQLAYVLQRQGRQSQFVLPRTLEDEPF